MAIHARLLAGSHSTTILGPSHGLRPHRSSGATPGRRDVIG